MIAEPRLVNADLNALFADAAAAERAGRLDEAIGALTVALADLHVHKEHHQRLLEWLGRLQRSRGDLAMAEACLFAARQAALEAGHRHGVFKVDIARARVAFEAGDVERADALLAELAGDAGPLGEVSPRRAKKIAAWLRRLAIGNLPRRGVAALRAELVLAIAVIWLEQGRCGAALELLDAVDLADARDGIQVDQARLFRAELLLASGRLREADEVCSTLPPGAGMDLVRGTLVRLRIAMVRGRLAEAESLIATLESVAATDPQLFTYSVVARAAFMVELNVHAGAEQLCRDAIGELDAGSGHRPFVDLIERMAESARARRRTAIALWELPRLPAYSGNDTSSDLLASEPGDHRFGARWTIAASRVLQALERGDQLQAAALQARLEEIAAGADSQYVRARVEMSAAMVDYHGQPGPRSLARLASVAQQFADMDARQDEAQAIRFAAWASARLGHVDEYVRLARRASDIVDAIANEFEDPRSRTLYMMNKWNGRDELVSGRMRELLRDASGKARVPSRREVIRVFQDIDRLTRWPIDDVFDEGGARQLDRAATSDAVAAWVTERHATKEIERDGFRLRSRWSLWVVPRRTLVLHYYTLPDRTYLFRIARRHIDLVVLPIGRIHLRTDIESLCDEPESLAELSVNLGIVDALARFPKVERLLVVAHDAIANVPFALLPLDGKPLCARLAISQIDRLGRLRRERRLPRDGTFVAIGLGQYAGSDFSDLGATEQEAKDVVTTFGIGTPVVHVGNAATCSALIDALPRATYLHLAAHGVFDLERPAESGIMLRSGDRFDRVTLRELRKLDLRGMALATLATCWSGASANLPGRERVSLPTALLFAGARGVVASLWPVRDTPSVEVMKLFYEHLRSESPSVALAKMQAERAAAGDDPRNWASLAYYGVD